MTRSRVFVAVVVLSIVVGLWWSHSRDSASSSDGDDEASSSGNGGGGHGRGARGRDGKLALGGGAGGSVTTSGMVVVTGTVMDAQSHQAVGNVEVVFRSGAGEETTNANADGTYRIVLPAATYRAFVRDDSVLSVGQGGRIRLPGEPSADSANAPDESVMPSIDARQDRTGIDLAVMRGGVVAGRVLDKSGKPIAHAVLRALSANGLKPALGTDVAESGEDGTFELRLPAGPYALDAAHPRFAGVSGGNRSVYVEPGDRVEHDVTLVAGCVIAGRVLGTDGKPAPDGAIERQWGTGDTEYRADGKIGGDGRFRWTTVAEQAVTLRAWPWKSPPSQSRTFDCREGARYEDVVFALPAKSPDIEGRLVDATGAPVPFAFIDLVPLDPGGIPQQERADAEGKWGVFAMPSGRYRVTAYAQGKGVVSSIVSSPQSGVRLALGGSGTISGTTIAQTGTLDVRIAACTVESMRVDIPDDHRIVSIANGRFEITDVPACNVEIAASWQDHREVGHAVVPANGRGTLALTLGPPRPQHVHVTVRDPDGRPAEGATVRIGHDGDVETMTTGPAGTIDVDTFVGADIAAMAVGSRAEAEVVAGQSDVVLTLERIRREPDEDGNIPPPPTPETMDIDPDDGPADNIIE